MIICAGSSGATTEAAVCCLTSAKVPTNCSHSSSSRQVERLLSFCRAPALAGLKLYKSGLTVWSLETGASQPLLYLALTTPCFYEEKQMCFPVSTKQSRSTLLYTECSNYKQENCCSKTETVIFNIFPNLPSTLPPSLLFFSRKNTTKELVVENNFSCLLPSILSTVKRCFICF